MNRLVIGTRASKLALAQTQTVIARLRQLYRELEIIIEPIHTQGDRATEAPLVQIGGDGVFVTEIERALRAGVVDLAVHSLKDLPTALPDGLLVLVPGPREDVRDVLVRRHDFLGSPAEPGVRIGTCSLRRAAQLRALYPQAQILPLRGNVDTRLRKLEAGEYDLIVLAAAGLSRLGLFEGLADRLECLPVEMLLPAPGQGALALELRADSELVPLVTPLNDVEVQAAASAERTFMRHLGAGCYLPVAAHAWLADDRLHLRALVISLDGRRAVRVQGSIAWHTEQALRLAAHLGMMLAEQALAQGAEEIIAEIRAASTV
ncbi:hydroxymethylbilane synthase [Thermogemmatispora carboxidivorans]|uniref:hydroxymethylbilane synthase n=1 Tax=Thermogemmatispora carboxidivorans TaxID=1382306 RepID=UPI000699D36A|nr:hydroxymethylbilane synthase [Thermogemmatispora carboxidivorans]